MSVELRWRPSLGGRLHGREVRFVVGREEAEFLHGLQALAVRSGDPSSPEVNQARALLDLFALFPGCRFVNEGRAGRVAAAAEGRGRGMGEVVVNADRGWQDEALRAIRRVCETRSDFISDDVWEAGLEGTREDRALGPLMLRAKGLGWCEKTSELRPSVRSHLSGKPVWRSLLFVEVAGA